MCFYNADTSEISYAPAPPRVYAAGSFAQDGTAINNVSYNCTCRSYTMVLDKARESFELMPMGFGLFPIPYTGLVGVGPDYGFGLDEPGHYKIIFNTPLTHVNYSITIQPQAVRHYLQLTTDVIAKTKEFFTFRICGTSNSLDEAFSITVFDYNA